MEKVKIGDLIKVIKMEGEPDYSNRVGTVTAIDGINYTVLGVAWQLSQRKIRIKF